MDKSVKSLFVFLFCFFSCLKADMVSDAVKRQVSSTLPTMEGWCTQEKAMNFFDLVLEVKPRICVEIGVFAGRSLFPVASALKLLGEGVVIAVDSWDKLECIKYFDIVEDQADLQWWAKLNINHMYTLYLGMVKKYGLEEHCKTIRATSEKAIQQIEFIDILHIDGNHSEIASTNDVLLYLPKVVSGGYIWMNDSLWESRQEAIEILLESCDVVKVIENGNCILFQKR